MAQQELIPPHVLSLGPGPVVYRRLALPSSVVSDERLLAAARVVDLAAFEVQKLGNTLGECEDAHAYHETCPEGQTVFAAAIADGATEALFSRQWAGLLVHHFLDQPQQRPWDVNWLAGPGASLRASVDFGSLPWFALEKAGRGAFATLLGLSFHLDEGSYWIRSVGDSCLAVVVEGDLQTIFPSHLATSEAFGNSPYLLGSNPVMNADLAESQFAQDPTPLSYGRSEFLLLTDAIGCWFVAAVERGEQPWQVLREIQCEEEFLAFASSQRESRQMRNDDVTLVRVAVDRWTGES